MKWIKRIIIGLIVLFIGAFFHYHLPSRDIVQISGTDVKRMDIGFRPLFWAKPDAGTAANSTRDVRFINAAWPNGNPRVYRNEDTNWSWPPYFKFDSGDMNAQAQNLAKSDEAVWVAVSHYGWRIKLLSMFPNAYKIKPVAGPDVVLIPWFNIVFLTLLGLLGLRIYLWIRKLKKRHVDPVTDKIGDVAEAAQDNMSEKRAGFRHWMRRWFGSTK